MRISRILLIVSTLVAAGFAPAPLPKPERMDDRPDFVKMQGVWLVTKPANEFCATSLVVVHNRMTYMRGSTVISEWSFTLDAKCNPKTLESKERGRGGRNFPGIYAVDRHPLKICYNVGNGGRPRSLAAKDPDDHVDVFHRKKP